MFLKLHYKESGREFLINTSVVAGVEINGKEELGCVLTLTTNKWDGERGIYQPNYEEVRETFQEVSLALAQVSKQSPAAKAYIDAMMAAGVPHEALQVYDSNSTLRVGLVRHYEERLYPYVATSGDAHICGIDLLHALVAAFNYMLEISPLD